MTTVNTIQPTLHFTREEYAQRLASVRAALAIAMRAVKL